MSEQNAPDPHDAPVVAGVQTTAQQVETEPEIRVSEDGNQIIRGEHKYIREEALRRERAENQQLKQALGALEPVLPEFKEYMENKRSGRQTAVTRATEPAPADDYSQDELIAVAQLNRYYTEDGQSLDLDRAKQALELMDRRAERHARRAVEPVVRHTAADMAARNRQAAVSRQFVDGAPVADPRYIQQAFDALPPELAADPGVAELVQVLAAGMETLDSRRTGKTARREPNYTEGPSGRFDGDGTGKPLSAFALRAAQSRGYTPEQWQKLQSKPTPDARADRDGGFVLETGL